MRLKTVISGLAAGCVLATGSRLWAQNTNATPTAPTNAPMMQEHLRPLPGGPGGAAPRRGLQAILSDEQWASFQKVNSEMRGKLMELRPKMQDAQREVFEAGLSPKFDESLVQQKAQAAAQIYAEGLLLQAKAFSEIQPPLSADQVAKIKELQSPPAAANPRVLRAPPQPGAPQPGAPTSPTQNGPPPKP